MRNRGRRAWNGRIEPLSHVRKGRNMSQPLNQAPPGTVYIANGKYPAYVLGVKGQAGDKSVWLIPRGEAEGNAYCYWLQFGDDGRFILYNVGLGLVMAYEGGNQGPLVMQEVRSPAPNSQAFSWGGVEEWGARALQAFVDSGQNVDAKGGDGPQTGPLHTRGWRHGDQMELTWNAVPVAAPVRTT